MKLEDLLGISPRKRPRTSPVDDIIGAEMIEAMDRNGGKHGPVTFKADTLDQLRAMSEGEISEDEPSCDCLKCLLNRKYAKVVYEAGEVQDYETILALHQGTKAVLDITFEMESAYAWKKEGYEIAIAQAKAYGLPVRAAALEYQLKQTIAYLEEWIPKLHAEMPCYEGLISKGKEEFESSAQVEFEG